MRKSESLKSIWFPESSQTPNNLASVERAGRKRNGSQVTSNKMHHHAEEEQEQEQEQEEQQQQQQQQQQERQ